MSGEPPPKDPATRSPVDAADGLVDNATSSAPTRSLGRVGRPAGTASGDHAAAGGLAHRPPAGPTTDDFDVVGPDTTPPARADIAPPGDDPTSPLAAGDPDEPLAETVAAIRTPRTRSWWRRADPLGPSMEGGSHLAHHLGYEVVQAMVVAAVLASLAFVGLGGRFSDLYVRARGAAPVSDQVALLTIGAEALYLWNPGDPEPVVTPRGLLAEPARFLDAAGARVIVLDILLDRPAPGDVELAAAAAAHGTVIGAERFVLSEPAGGREFAAAITAPLNRSIDAGFANLLEEEASLFSGGELLVRKAPLVRRLARARMDGRYPGNLVGGEQADAEVRPALALLAAWLHAGRRTTADAAKLANTVQLNCAGSPMDCTVDAESLGLPALPAGLAQPLPINFRGPERAAAIPTLTASQTLRVMGQDALMRSLGVEMPLEIPAELAAAVRDRTVVVCRVDDHSGDRFVTPYSFPMLMRTDMAGGRIQAQLIDTLLSGRHIRPLPGWIPWLLGLLLGAGMVLTRRWLRDDTHSLAWLAVGLALVAGGAWLFAATDGVVLELGPALCVGLVTLMVLRVHGWAREG